MAHNVEALCLELGKFLPSCPLCQKERTTKLQFHVGWSMRDYVTCSNCNARWLIDDSGDLKWIKLIEAGSSGKGEGYLGTENEPAFWFNMIQNKPVVKQTKKEQELPIVRERQIIRETEITKKEVIYKVRCPYCGKLYNEVLDVCPHCGGKR